jgi:hypothetical protein
MAKELCPNINLSNYLAAVQYANYGAETVVSLGPKLSEIK